MAIASYTDLQAAIANYLARPGDALVATPAPDFVTLAESRIAYGADAPFPSRPLRIRAMETTVNLITGPTQQDTGAASGGSANAQTVTLAATPTLASGLTIGFTAGFSNTGTTTLNPNGLGAIPFQKGIPAVDLVAGDPVAGAAYVAYFNAAAFKLVPFGGVQMAAGYLQMKSIFVQGSPEQQLTPVTPETYNASWMSSRTGKPRAYVLDADAIRFGPVPDTTYAVQMSYYRKFPALASASGGTNWLMTNKPDVYLYGSLLEAAIYLRFDDDAQFYFGLYRSAVEGLQTQDVADRYSGAVLQQRSGICGP
jgi:hypothetical protein